MKFNDLCNIILEDAWDEEFHFWKVGPFQVGPDSDNTFLIFSKEIMTCRQLMVDKQVAMDMETMISTDSMLADPDSGPLWSKMSVWDFAAENSEGVKNFRKIDFRDIINSGRVAVIGDLLENNRESYDKQAWIDLDGEMCIYACKDVEKIQEALRNKLMPVIEYDYRILDDVIGGWTNVQFSNYKTAKPEERPKFIDLDEPDKGY